MRLLLTLLTIALGAGALEGSASEEAALAQCQREYASWAQLLDLRGEREERRLLRALEQRRDQLRARLEDWQRVPEEVRVAEEVALSPVSLGQCRREVGALRERAGLRDSADLRRWVLIEGMVEEIKQLQAAVEEREVGVQVWIP
jgi:hypothetical protein